MQQTQAQAYILLRKLGFALAPLDYAVDKVEGVALYRVDQDYLHFVLKSRTNMFTPGLFQHVCVACATMGKGTVRIDIEVGAEAGLEAVVRASEFGKYVTHVQKHEYAYAFSYTFDYTNAV